MSAGDKFIVAPISTLGSCRGYNKRQKIFWTSFIFTRRKSIIDLLYNKGKKQIYGNPLFPRIWGYYSDDSADRMYRKIELLNTIWEGKNVLVVEGPTCKLGIDTDVLYKAKSVRRIIAPEKNAFDKYTEIIDTITQVSGVDIILLVLGPTATA